MYASLSNFTPISLLLLGVPNWAAFFKTMLERARACLVLIDN